MHLRKASPALLLPHWVSLSPKGVELTVLKGEDSTEIHQKADGGAGRLGDTWLMGTSRAFFDLSTAHTRKILHYTGAERVGRTGSVKGGVNPGIEEGLGDQQSLSGLIFQARGHVRTVPNRL